MTINSAARTISLTKKEMTAASRFGTVEYQNLQAARRDYPGFEVVTITRKVKTTRETYKGLTYDFMENISPTMTMRIVQSWRSTRCIAVSLRILPCRFPILTLIKK